MSTQAIIFIIAIAMILVIAFTRLRGGPRVTQIDRTVRREKDEPEDRSDA